MTGFTTAELLDEIQQLEQEPGEIYTSVDMKGLGEYWAADYQDHFGELERVIEEFTWFAESALTN